MICRAVCIAIVCATHVAAADRDAGYTVAVGAGLNVGAPFAELQLGRRFERAKHFEFYLDYSYDAAISSYRFQTFGLGVRTYLAHVVHCELFHQALASFAISQAGDLRTIGDRVLGGFFTQGLGLQVTTGAAWTVELVVALGTPVWLRTDLAVKYRF